MVEAILRWCRTARSANAAQQGDAAVTKQLVSAGPWCHSGGGRQSFGPRTQRCLVQLIADPLGGATYDDHQDNQ